MMTTLPVAAIQPDPDQPRKRFAQTALDELADSIRSVGLLEPIIVRPVAARMGEPRHWRIIAGERRWRAAGLAGLERIPVIVRDDLEAGRAFELQMIENVIRADMDPMEEAEGYGRLLESGLTVDQVAERIGKSAQSIKARLKLLSLSSQAADLVAKGHLSTWDAARIAGLSDEGQAKVLRAMAEGRVPKGDNNAIDRLCTAIAEIEQQASLVDDDWFTVAPVYTELAAIPTPDPARKARRDLDAQLDSIMSTLAKLADYLEGGVEPSADPHELDELACKVHVAAGRITKALRTQAAVKVAASL